MSLIDGPDCSIWVEHAGEGEPITVFAHGVTGSMDEVRPLASATVGTRVLMDLRGHGRSDSPPEEAGYDHEAMSRDIRAVADRFGARRAFGISLSAGAILRILAHDPNRFERVCLLLPASIDSVGSHYPPLADLLERHPLDEVARLTLSAPEQQPLFERRPYWRELVRARIMRMNATGVPRALRAYVAGAAPVDEAEALRRVQAPVLIVSHEGDPVHDAEHARRLAWILPNARLEIWPEPLAMFDDVGSFAASIASFFSE